MRVQLTKMWSGLPPGHIFPGMHPGMANTLVQRGVAKVIQGDKPPAVPKPDPAVSSTSNDNDSRTTTAPNDRSDKPAPKRSGRKKAT